eukprot:5381301-Amphidinium_carterae.2
MFEATSLTPLAGWCCLHVSMCDASQSQSSPQLVGGLHTLRECTRRLAWVFGVDILQDWIF